MNIPFNHHNGRALPRRQQDIPRPAPRPALLRESLTVISDQRDAHAFALRMLARACWNGGDGRVRDRMTFHTEEWERLDRVWTALQEEYNRTQAFWGYSDDPHR